jgi:hypothetical protein
MQNGGDAFIFNDNSAFCSRRFYLTVGARSVVFESGSLIGRKAKRNSIRDSAPIQGLLDFQLLFVFR